MVDRALQILTAVGLPDLTMRRLGQELGVQQSALYHHFANKQALLGAVADEILARGPRTDRDGMTWEQVVRTACEDLRAAVLAFPDGADVVQSMTAFGLGGQAAHDDLRAALEAGGVPAGTVGVAARTLVHYVYGHAVAQQARETATRLGAIPDGTPPPGAAGSGTVADDEDFARGLDLVVSGVAATVAR